MLFDITKIENIQATFFSDGQAYEIHDQAANAIDTDMETFCGLIGSLEKSAAYQWITYNLTITLPEPMDIKNIQALRFFDYDDYKQTGKEYIQVSTGSSWTTVWSNEQSPADGTKLIIAAGVWPAQTLVRFKAEFIGKASNHEFDFNRAKHKLFDLKIYAEYEQSINFYDSGKRIQTATATIKAAYRDPAESWETVAIHTAAGTKRLALVETASPAASKLRINTADGIKAVAEYR